ncbi:PREDICTED: THO complex subunit 5A [Camelina sativa]|uniref:THO complex subunit 5A n=1 Tax=Camelina sativa TaxID=90675 RepID=A0ABM0X155_CAMSA|nr:PREDICTED: THO complex subunit 5A [Camelina sativa]
MQSEMANDTVATAEKSPVELLQETKAYIEAIVERMLSITQQGNPKSENRELLTQMFLNFINLRQANRAILVEEEKAKTETELAKSPVDFTTLELHNLMYEKSRYLKANKASRDFKSRYPNIDLISEQEFFSEAPEAIKSQTLSNDTSHDLMLKRLNFELHQRKELCKLRARLEQHKKSLLESNAERNKFLSSLPVHLKSLKKASLPVQSQLSLPNPKKLKYHNLAELLPPPLYVIYSQFMARKEAFEENIDLEVSGSLKDAQTYARQQAEQNSESLRLEDDGKRQRKRPKKEVSDEGGLYQSHPLKVVLHIYDVEIPDPKSDRPVLLKFEYLLKLNVVCVGIEESQDDLEKNILCNLFPEDAGLEPPHQSAKLILGDDHLFDESRTSRPYKWAQHLAGIEILPEMSPFFTDKDTQTSDTAVDYASASDHRNVQTVLQRIRSQKKTKLTLV